VALAWQKLYVTCLISARIQPWLLAGLRSSLTRIYMVTIRGRLKCSIKSVCAVNHRTSNPGTVCPVLGRWCPCTLSPTYLAWCPHHVGVVVFFQIWQQKEGYWDSCHCLPQACWYALMAANSVAPKPQRFGHFLVCPLVVSIQTFLWVDVVTRYTAG
jgi:hypothetical protein